MGFMRSDEHLLLMNYNSTVTIDATHIMTLDERIKLNRHGIYTAIEYPRWTRLEPQKGAYNFEPIETIIRLNREAHTKTILSVCGSELPDWMPNDWFAKQKDGKVRREVLSLWNKEAQDYKCKFYEKIIKEFSAPDVMFILGEYMEGEAILPCEPSFYDDAAIEDYNKYWDDSLPDINSKPTKLWLYNTALKYFVDLQKLFIQQHNEIWNMQQWLMNTWSQSTINYVQPELMKMYKEKFPEANIVLLQYTYYDEYHPQENVNWVKRLRELSNCEVIVEAHFCKGLKETTPKAITEGFRGQILCPIHVMSGQSSMETWMYKEIKRSCELWLEKS